MRRTANRTKHLAPRFAGRPHQLMTIVGGRLCSKRPLPIGRETRRP